MPPERKHGSVPVDSRTTWKASRALSNMGTSSTTVEKTAKVLRTKGIIETCPEFEQFGTFMASWQIVQTLCALKF